MLISDEYRKQQRELHAGNYGVSGDKYATLVIESGYSDILDYGCGKKLLQDSLGFAIANYDPAFKELANNNEPHEFVYCGDVLEHVEPDCLDDVLQDIKRCMLKAGILVIATVPAKKFLKDGRNAHLIVHGGAWWVDKISQYFTITKTESNAKEVILWVTATG